MTAPRGRPPSSGTPDAERDPPPGPPWDVPLAEAPLVFVDLEMTGLDVARDRVIEICAERVRGGVVEDRLESLVRPECGTFGNLHVHGIAEAELEAAPTFGQLAPALLRLLDGAILIAHGAAWDVAFLEAELAKIGPARKIGHYLDTLNLSRRAMTLPSHRLAALCDALGIVRDRAHRAGDDVRALRAVWDRVITMLGPTKARDLWEVRVGKGKARPGLVEAAVRAADSDVPVRVRYRPSGRGPEDLMMRITEVRTDLDPPRVLGYLLPARSRRELRADRILAIEPAEPASPSGAPETPGRRRG